MYDPRYGSRRYAPVVNHFHGLLQYLTTKDTFSRLVNVLSAESANTHKGKYKYIYGTKARSRYTLLSATGTTQRDFSEKYRGEINYRAKINNIEK